MSDSEITVRNMSQPFVAVPLSLVNDPSLSYEEKGIAAALLACDNVPVDDKVLAQKLNLPLDTLRRVVLKLGQRGYFEILDEGERE